MTREEAIEILIAVAVCDRPILSCDFCVRYVGMGTDCTYPSDKEIEEAVLLLKGASKDAAISALRQQEHPRWISVNDRMPAQTDPAQKVLFIKKTGGVFIGCYYKATDYDKFSGWYSMGIRIDNVTHWMPLPDAPEEDWHEM